MIRRILHSITLLGLFLELSGQTTAIVGTVADERGEVIIGANVFVKGAYDGTSTDADGSFHFTTDETGPQTLVVSYIGYETREQTLDLRGDTLRLHIKLRLAANELTVVTITAGAFEAGDSKKTTVLNSLDIVTTAGALADVTAAMNTLPGAQRVGETGMLFVRGGAARETRAFIDGMFVQNPFGGSVPNVPARGRFSPFLFKGMMFSTGGYSAEYGQALSSALILHTQDLAPETVTGISLMTVGGGLSHTQRWKRSSLAVSADYSNLAPYMRLVPQNIEWEKAPNGVNGQVIFRHKTSETGLLKFQAQGSRNGFEMQYPDAAQVNLTNHLHLTNDNYFASGSYRELLGDRWSLFLGGGYTWNRDAIAEQFRVNTREQSAQGKATLQYTPSDRLNIKTGGEWIHNRYDQDYTDADGLRFSPRLRENYAAAFTEGEWTLGRKVAARAGLRVERSQLLWQWNAAPRLSFAFKTSENSQVSLAYGQFYQTPENELLRYNTRVNFEKAGHYILNYQYVKDRRIFRVEGYYKSYHQLLKFETDTPWQSGNSGGGYARGVDVFLRDSRSIKNTDFWVSYSYLDTERDYLDFPQRATPVFASRHNASAVVKRWFPGITTSMGLTYSFVSPRPYHDPNTDTFNGGRTRSYHDLSFNASYLTQIGRHFTILHLSVSNVLGLEQEFGYRFSRTPDADGQFSGTVIQPPARQFFFVGMFVSIGKKGTLSVEEILN
ncbi:MAG: TonB-dependent receptor [Saprospiraceae bacterium]|nr:TonB-dependent receptor [Saprospiraceae bacterium]